MRFAQRHFRGSDVIFARFGHGQKGKCRVVSLDEWRKSLSSYN